MNMIAFRRKMLMAMTIKKWKMLAKLSQGFSSRATATKVISTTAYTKLSAGMKGVKGTTLSIVGLVARGKASLGLHVKGSAVSASTNVAYLQLSSGAHLASEATSAITVKTAGIASGTAHFKGYASSAIRVCGRGKISTKAQALGNLTNGGNLGRYGVLNIKTNILGSAVNATTKTSYIKMPTSYSMKAYLRTADKLYGKMSFPFEAKATSSIGNTATYGSIHVVTNILGNAGCFNGNMYGKMPTATHLKACLQLASGMYGKINIPTNLAANAYRKRRIKLADWIGDPLSDLMGVSLEEASWTIITQ